jgi:hypothetical protein
VRKDIERAFGVLVKRFSILKQRFRLWFTDDIMYLMYACIILHNMFIEARRPNYNAAAQGFDEMDEDDDGAAPAEGGPPHVSLFSIDGQPADPAVAVLVADRVAALSDRLSDEPSHINLKNDLIAHINNED